MKYQVFAACVLMPAQVLAQSVVPTLEKVPELKLVAPESIVLDPPLQTLPDGEDNIVELTKGAVAPFEGHLFDVDTAIRWGFWLQQWRYRYQADLARERNLCAVQQHYQLRVLNAERYRAAQVESDLNQRLLRAEQARLAAEEREREPGFFDSPAFYYGLGVVTAGALVGVGVWAVNR